MEGGYQVINSDDGVVYSQVIVFKKNDRVMFYDNGQIQSVSNKNEDGQLNGLYKDWYENGQKRFEGNYEDGELISEKYWNEDGSVKE